jgi:predicted MFS family arabinose efflux permease
MPLLVLAVGGKPTAIGVVLLAAMVPRIVFTLVGGVLADRGTPRQVMIGADLLSATSQFVLASLYATDRANVSVIAALAMVHGIGASLFMPASASIVPSLVHKGELRRANARVSVALSIGGIVGAGLGGVIAATFGLQTALVIDAATFLASACLVFSLRPSPGSRDEPAPDAKREDASPGIVTLVREGTREAFRRSWFGIVMVLHLVYNTAAAAWFVGAPLAAMQYFGGPAAWGLLSASSTAGGLLGGILASKITTGHPLRLSTMLFGTTGFMMILLRAQVQVWVLVVVVLLALAAATVGSVLWTTVVQESYQSNVLARVNAVDYSLAMVGAVLGFLLAGPLIALLGLTAAMTCLGLSLLATSLVVTAVLWRR